MVVFAALMLAVVWLGLDTLSWTALAAGAATVALAAWGLSIVVGDRDVGLLGDAHATQAMSFLAAVAARGRATGRPSPCAPPTSPTTWRRARDVRVCAVTGLMIPVAAFASVGAALWLSTGTWNLADVLHELGSPAVAYGFLAVGFTGSVMTNLHSGALALSDAAAPRAPSGPALLAVAAVGTALAALRFSQWMIPYLTAMAVAAPALIAVLWWDALRAPAGVARPAPAITFGVRDRPGTRPGGRNEPGRRTARPRGPRGARPHQRGAGALEPVGPRALRARRGPGRGRHRRGGRPRRLDREPHGPRAQGQVRRP